MKKGEMVKRLAEETGLSRGAVWYRLSVGLPMSMPRGGYHNRGVYLRARGATGSPAGCTIQNKRGRDERCYSCTSYERCMDFASDRNWRGWRILEAKEVL